MAFIVTCCAEPGYALILPEELVVSVGHPVPILATSTPITISQKFTANHAITRSTSKKTKGKRVFKTTKVKDQYGHTVYKKTTSHKKKKKH